MSWLKLKPNVTGTGETLTSIAHIHKHKHNEAAATHARYIFLRFSVQLRATKLVMALISSWVRSPVAGSMSTANLLR
jgi:hypothetical protein